MERNLNKVIFAIWGESNVGKSSSIKYIFEQIKNSYPLTYVKHPNKDFKDFAVIFDIGGKKIGIESQGDPNSRMFDSLVEWKFRPN